MQTSELVERYSRLFHMTAEDAWPTIELHGLLSVTALLDLLDIEPFRRRVIETERRPTTVFLADPTIGQFEIRDQKPLNLTKLKSCLIAMTVNEWLALLNRKVFFWPTEARVEQLLAAKAYRSSSHLVLLIRTESLVARYGSNITLTSINTGAVLYNPPARGRDTLLSISAYPYDEWRRRRGPRTAIAEVAVDYAVPDVRDHVICVQRRQYGQPSEILFSG